VEDGVTCRQVTDAEGKSLAEKREQDPLTVKKEARDAVDEVLQTDPAENERLFSLVDPSDGFRHQPGSLLSMIALVAGTTVGAGCLALPAVSVPVGLLPSTSSLIAAWLYMLVSGLLLAEVSLHTMCTLGRSGISILSMAELTLGKAGAGVASAVYVFLHYALLVAYMGQGGNVLAEQIGSPTWFGTVLFSAVVGGSLFIFPSRAVDQANVALVALTVFTFCSLVLGTAPSGDQLSALATSSDVNWGGAFGMLPTAVLAMVYHNVVPVVCAKLEGDVARVRSALIAGSSLPLVMFLVWNGDILASASSLISSAAAGTDGIVDPLAEMRRASNSSLGQLVSVFSELAIITSFIGFVYGLTEFVQDALRSKQIAQTQQQEQGAGAPVDSQHGATQTRNHERNIAFSATLIPPCMIAVISPDLFFSALDSAGAFGISILFGALPALMAWQVRRRRQVWISEDHERTSNTSTLVAAAKDDLVPGGIFVLTLMVLGAAALITNEALERLLPFLQPS